MRVLDEEDEPPLQGLGRGFATGQEQIQTTQDQVAVVKTQIAVCVVLSDRPEGQSTAPSPQARTYSTY